MEKMELSRMSKETLGNCIQGVRQDFRNEMKTIGAESATLTLKYDASGPEDVKVSYEVTIVKSQEAILRTGDLGAR